MIVMDWIRKLTDMIMPLEAPVPDDEEEVKETKKAEVKPVEPQSAQVSPLQQQPAQAANQNFQAERQPAAMGAGMSQNLSFGTMNFTRNGGMVSTAENGVTSMGGYRYEAYASDNNASVRPSLAVVKTPSINVKIYAPTKYDEQVKSIGSDLMQRNALVVNYENVDEGIQQRIGDFILGVVYANDGKVEMISNRIMLYVPSGFDVENAPLPAMRRY